jgi:hypothetical protein
MAKSHGNPNGQTPHDNVQAEWLSLREVATKPGGQSNLWIAGEIATSRTIMVRGSQ